jgi:hypothetical protein
MRTKALLTAAAALAAGIITSNAQVYSQNIVGYTSLVNPTGQLTLIANPLDLDGTGTNNTVSTVFTAPVIGDTIYAFNGSSYDTVSYTVVSSGHGSTAVHSTNWYEGVAVATTYSLNPGRGFFYSPAVNETNVIVGSVLQGTNLVNSQFPAANTYNILSSVAPEAGAIQSGLNYNPSIGDTLLVYSAGSYNTYSYTIVSSGHGSTATHATNWYNGVTPSQPSIAVGQGFWFDPATTTNWTENFVVNP